MQKTQLICGVWRHNEGSDRTERFSQMEIVQLRAGENFHEANCNCVRLKRLYTNTMDTIRDSRSD